MENAYFERTLAAFAAAVTTGDEEAAKEAASASAWHFGGETPRELFRQSQGGRGFILDASDTVTVSSDRAWGYCHVYQRLNANADGPPRAFGRLRIMMESDGIAGVAKERSVVDAWLAGMIPASARMASLPISEAGQRWAEGIRTAVLTGSDLSKAAGDPTESGVMATMMLGQSLNQRDAVIAILPSRQIPAAGRVAIGFLITTPLDDLGNEVWVTLQAKQHDNFSIVGTSSYMSVPLLLQDAERLQRHAPVATAKAPEATSPVAHWDPFAAAVEAATGDTSQVDGEDGTSGHNIIGPAPLLEQPEVTAEMRDALAETMAILQDKGTPTNVAELREQTSQLLNAALAGVVRAISSQTGAVRSPDIDSDS